MSGRLKDIRDFRVSQIEHLSGGFVLIRETIAPDGSSSGKVFIEHPYQPDPAAHYAACHCGRTEGDPIHVQP